jgi:hypothetical protein
MRRRVNLDPLYCFLFAFSPRVGTGWRAGSCGRGCGTGRDGAGCLDGSGSRFSTIPPF